MRCADRRGLAVCWVALVLAAALGLVGFTGLVRAELARAARLDGRAGAAVAPACGPELAFAFGERPAARLLATAVPLSARDRRALALQVRGAAE